MLLMLSAAPVLWVGNPGLKLRDLVVEFSRWVLGPWVFSTVDYGNPLLAGGSELPNNSRWILPGHPSFDAATPSDSRQLQLRP